MNGSKTASMQGVFVNKRCESLYPTLYIMLMGYSDLYLCHSMYNVSMYIFTI